VLRAATARGGALTALALVAGPADREHFFAAQARNRRAARRLTAVAALGVALMGVPMSAVISPLVYAALIILNDLVSLVIPAADLLRLGESDWSPGASDHHAAVVAVLLAVALVLPGTVVMLLAWLGVRTLFLRHGTDGLLRSLDAREPRAGDLEERQLQNLVEEMAVAGGIRRPRVVILDGVAANAGAVGSGPDDATLIVSRRLLDELDRDESQGVIAQLVGSVGNGDLRAALAIVSMHRAFGVVMAVLGAPFGPQARKTLLGLMRLGLRRGRPVEARELHELDEMLSETASGPESDVHPEKEPKLSDVLKLPFLAAYTAFSMSRLAFVSFVVGPLLALIWRSRRYLADATAVQLTRNPDGVARGLAALAARGSKLPGGTWAAPLFVVEPERKAGSGFRGDEIGIVSYTPPFSARITRLRRQGATVELPRRGRGTMHWLARVCVALFVVLAGGALICCALLVSYITLMFDMLILAPVLLATHGALRWLAG
jgi:Zn-dependent protease with chaperone function